MTPPAPRDTPWGACYPGAVTIKDEADARRWDAVEEASELIHEGQYQDALYLLKDIAKADPENPYAFYFMGVALYEAAQLEPARDAFRAAVRVAPGYVGARGSLAQVLRRLHDYEAAIREGEAALRIAPEDQDALHAVGLAHAALGERANATHFLERFLATKPELEPAQEARQVLEMLKLGDGPLEVE